MKFLYDVIFLLLLYIASIIVSLILFKFLSNKKYKTVGELIDDAYEEAPYFLFPIINLILFLMWFTFNFICYLIKKLLKLDVIYNKVRNKIRNIKL